MAVLEDIKILLDIPVNEHDIDEKLNLIISNTQRKVLSYLPAGTKSVPADLEYIVCEMAIARFNRIGNEGMSSYSQEGESLTYTADDIAPYLSDIQEWNKKQQSNTRGVVRFL